MMRFFRVVFWQLAFLSALAVAFIVLNRPSNRVLATWRQPDSIQIDDSGPYFVSVVEGGLDWSHLPFSVGRRYFIYCGKEDGKPTHGHVIEYSFHPSVHDLYNIDAHVKKSSVEWTNAGATFLEASGHALFIPSFMFAGGR